MFFTEFCISQVKKNARSHNAMQDSLKPGYENLAASHGYARPATYTSMMPLCPPWKEFTGKEKETMLAIEIA